MKLTCRTTAAHGTQADSKAVGRTIVESDLNFEAKDSVVYKESRQRRVFRYREDPEFEPLNDLLITRSIQRCLGAAQFVFEKLVRNCWLEGIRAKVENSVEFLPFASHQHCHAVGSSKVEHDPQSMADFIKESIDSELAKPCSGVYADVLVAVIPSAASLTK